MSGVDFSSPDGSTIRSIRKGAAEAMRNYVISLGGSYPEQVDQVVQEISKRGSTPLVVVEGNTPMGVIELKDVVKGGIKERFVQFTDDLSAS